MNLPKEKILELVLATLPYPDQIKDIDMTTDNYAIRFTWRFNRFRISDSLNVETIQNDCLVGCSTSILMRTLLKNNLKEFV